MAGMRDDEESYPLIRSISANLYFLMQFPNSGFPIYMSTLSPITPLCTVLISDENNCSGDHSFNYKTIAGPSLTIFGPLIICKFIFTTKLLSFGNRLQSILVFLTIFWNQRHCHVEQFEFSILQQISKMLKLCDVSHYYKSIKQICATVRY